MPATFEPGKQELAKRYCIRWIESQSSWVRYILSAKRCIPCS